jgi:two-component system, OmpR family, sensor histidine kinase KdpD
MVREYLEVLVAVAAVTAVSRYLPLSYTAYGNIYLLAVVLLSLRVSRWPVLFAAVASAAAWDYYFVTPRMSFAILHFDDVLLVATYFVVALIAGQSTTYVREREKLRAEAALNRTLLDSVAHELKTPLSVLRFATEQLARADERRRQELRDEMIVATLRLERLVANLLDQTRLESGALAPRIDWCDVRDIISASRRAVGGALDGRQVKIEVAPDMPLVMADPSMMEQAVSNLLFNAALHTPAGTPIAISAGVDNYSGNAFLSVADRGPGLPIGFRRDAFEKFRRGEGAPAGGLGLGLSIVRGFVVAQGGQVFAGDNPGGGACFTIHMRRGTHAAVPSE